MYYSQHYVVDWDKVESLDDLKLIVSAMNIVWGPDCDISDIKHLVKLVEKSKETVTLG